MKWSVQLLANELFAYEFTAQAGHKLVCKFNPEHGSIRLKYQHDQHGVFMVDNHHLHNRKFTLYNVYGSEIATLTRNLWKENSGHIHSLSPNKKVNYRIDAFSSLIEVSEGNVVHTCSIQDLPHPGREAHCILLVVALSWMMTVATNAKVEVAA